MKKISWRELIVSDCDGPIIANMDGKILLTLGRAVKDNHHCLDSIDEWSVEDGITEWTDHYVSAPGEEPDWDTPRVPVDWSGFGVLWMEA